MCPDRQILSVYLDKELPSPWKEKMEAHIASCSECQALLEQYQAVSALANSEKNDLTELQNSAKERIWEQFSDLPFNERKTVLYHKNHSLSLPLPAAIAAALLIVFMAAFIGSTISRPSQNLNAVAALEAQNVIPSADLARIIQFLDAQDDASSMMIINLPETEDFTSLGEPALIRAADYSRGKTYR